MSKTTVAPPCKVWVSKGVRWMADSTGHIWNADTGEVWEVPKPVWEVTKDKEIRGTKWLAETLGVSRQRASKLLNSGRVVGAVRNPNTGAWDLSRLLFTQVREGKRGPRLGANRQRNERVRRAVK